MLLLLGVMRVTSRGRRCDDDGWSDGLMHSDGARHDRDDGK